MTKAAVREHQQQLTETTNQQTETRGAKCKQTDEITRYTWTRVAEGADRLVQGTGLTRTGGNKNLMRQTRHGKGTHTHTHKNNMKQNKKKVNITLMWQYLLIVNNIIFSGHVCEALNSMPTTIIKITTLIMVPLKRPANAQQKYEGQFNVRPVPKCILYFGEQMVPVEFLNIYKQNYSWGYNHCMCKTGLSSTSCLLCKNYKSAL